MMETKRPRWDIHDVRGQTFQSHTIGTAVQFAGRMQNLITSDTQIK